MSHALHPSVLREYDIRGIVGETLGVEDARAIGRSFATLVRRAGGTRVAVGYDGRISSPALKQALVEGLTASGVDVVEIGLGPSPMLYYAEASAADLHGGVQVTGSHNPKEHNGFKLVLGGQPFFGADIVELGRVAAAGEWLKDPGVCQGRVERRAILPAYVRRLLEALDGLDSGALAGMRIGWDAGNGSAGPAVEALTALLPGEHHLLYTDVDGHFPHHHPDPTEERNLADLKALVAAKRLHFGVAFDGDGDRIGVVDGFGRVVWGDQLLMIYAEDLLRALPGATIIADVKCSNTLFDRIATLGGRPLMWKTGHSVLKSKMNELAAPLAGEMSGHMFFGHGWYGFDDALFAAVQLIAASVRLGRSVTDLRSEVPELASTPELRFAVEEDRKFAVVDEVRERLEAGGALVDTTDGVRVTTDDGWWLLRASNTQAMLTARAEGRDPAGLERLLGAIDDELALSGVRRAV
ncbi:MAG: phosphomannomutase/phosphoglucomutase [Novosphingobium sp.]